MQHSSTQPFVSCLSLALLLSGCAANYPHIRQSEGHISAAEPAVEAGEIPAPVKTTTFVPPPKAVEKPQTYSVVVNEVSARELLFALARDTKQNIDVHPGIQGLVTLNAVNETLPAILERIARQVNMRYKLEGDTLVVTPDIPYFKTYNVGYVNLARNTTSSISVSGQISASGTGQGGAPQSAAGAGNTSSTSVSSVSNNNFWEVLRDNLRSILSSTRAQSLGADDKAARAEGLKAAREERLQQAEAVSRAGASADKLFATAFGGGSPALPGDVKDDIVINPVAGTVSVLATEKQHVLVQQYISGVVEASQRQVLIEATIVEVSLTDEYQAGVDFARLGNFSVKQTLIGGTLGTPPFTSIAYAVGGSTNLTTTIKLLEQFGKTRVLSSPKLMALNNQTALLKVVDNVVYFSVQAVPAVLSTVSGVGAVSQQTFNTTAQTVPVGLVMSVTPQINENGAVSLIVRPTISRITQFVNDPNPGLVVTTTVAGLPFTSAISNPVPQIQTREMESVLQVNSGQTVILGGLMQDNEDRKRDAIPGLGKIPLFGDVFSFRHDTVGKTELMIFLRPTVITNASLESDELKFFRRFLPEPDISGANQ
jgi:MSHA type pilus biogenesis protein MshL